MDGAGAFGSWPPARRWLAAAAAAALALAVAVAAWLWPGLPTETAEPARAAGALAGGDSAPGGAAGPPTSPALALPTALPALPLGNGADAPSGPLPMARYFELRDEAACRCKVRDVAVEQMKSELIACRALLAGGAEFNRPALEGVAAGRVAYDPAAAARCLREAVSCGDGESKGTACAEVLRGLVQSGGVCHEIGDCTSGFCVKRKLTDETGTCVAKLTAGSPCEHFWDCPGALDLHCIGGTCQPPPTRAGERCEYTCMTEGLWCDKDAKPPVCRPAIGQGGSCKPDELQQCRQGLACQQSRAGFRCAAPAQQEEACDPERINDDCGRGLFCVPVAGGGRCLARAELGEPCAGDGQCPFSEAYCAGSTATKPGRCEALPIDGEPCAGRRVFGGRCRMPFVCDVVRQVCVVNLAEGDPCEGRVCGGPPFAITCVPGVCRARQPEGAPCEEEPQGRGAEGELQCERKLACVAGRCVKP